MDVLRVLRRAAIKPLLGLAFLAILVTAGIVANQHGGTSTAPQAETTPDVGATAGPTATPTPATPSVTAEVGEACVSEGGTIGTLDPSKPTSTPTCTLQLTGTTGTVKVVALFDAQTGKPYLWPCADWTWAGGEPRWDPAPSVGSACGLVPPSDPGVFPGDCQAARFYKPGSFPAGTTFRWEDVLGACLPA